MELANLYGLKQAAREWHKVLAELLVRDLDFVRCASYPAPVFHNILMQICLSAHPSTSACLRKSRLSMFS